MTRFSSRIVKGGALLDDTRVLVRHWDFEVDSERNLRRLIEENLLAKNSRSRTDDVLRVLRPRLVQPGPHVLLALHELLDEPRSFREACYYEASRVDLLLAAFAEDALFSWHLSGRVGVDVRVTEDWVGRQDPGAAHPIWAEPLRNRMAQGLLSTLRDFGILRGAVRKELASPGLSVQGFAYVAFRLHEEGASSRQLVQTGVWRRWLLDRTRSEALFAEAHRLGVLQFAKAGSAVRIDWLVTDLTKAVHAAA